MAEEFEGGDRPPQLPVAIPAYTKYDTMTTVEVCKAMKKVRDDYEEREKVVKELKREYDFLRLLKVPQRFEEEGIDILKIDGVGRVNLTADMYVYVPVDAREEVYQWLRDTGREACIKETVNASTLKALCKEVYKKGEETLPEKITVTPFQRAGITKTSG